MSERKELGRITKVQFGIGGYQDAMLGMSFCFEGKGWGVWSPFYGSWCPGMIDPDGPNFKWTEATRSQAFDETMRKLGETLRAAKKSDLSQLTGVPVEVTFDGMTIKDWRVLTEVL